MTLTIIKGAPSEHWETVQESQHRPFLYIVSNGSKWAGEEPDDLDDLLLMLGSHPLREERGDHGEVDPCEGIRNDDRKTPNAPRWVNGPRLFAVDGVRHYSGNFEDISHVFSLYTNDRDTIATLDAALAKNLAGTE